MTNLQNLLYRPPNQEIDLLPLWSAPNFPTAVFLPVTFFFGVTMCHVSSLLNDIWQQELVIPLAEAAFVNAFRIHFLKVICCRYILFWHGYAYGLLPAFPLSSRRRRLSHSHSVFLHSPD